MIPSQQVASIWSIEPQQQCFRALLSAMSYPGRCQALPIVEGSPDGNDTALLVLATLLDGEVTLCDHHQRLGDDDVLKLQTRLATHDAADYLLCDGAQPADVSPRLGELTDPETSTTLVITVDSVSAEASAAAQTYRLTGPGIQTENLLSIVGLDESWISAREGWVAAFPLGVDMILVDQTGQVAALPRTTQLSVVTA